MGDSFRLSPQPILGGTEVRVSEHEGRLAGGAVFFRACSVPRPTAHVVISDGDAEHSGRYSDVAGVLLKTGISVWALDLRGHGLSDGEPASALATVVGAVSSDAVTARLWPGLFHEIFNEPTGGAAVGALVDWPAERVG